MLINPSQLRPFQPSRQLRAHVSPTAIKNSETARGNLASIQ